jgi:hypothetical protein
MENNFIPRKFKNIESNDIVDFEEVVNSSNISVILGEPASGKTYQLKEYTQNNKNSILLKSRHVTRNKTQKKQILLFDSIDEALISYPNIKDDLIDYIEENQDKKFVITCRYLEWKEYFEKELKELDDELKIYEIIALSKKEIDNLLKEEDRKFFWKFIDDNHLESLLKNIMIIFHLVENFRSYDNNSNYVNIYKKIVKEYITKIGEDREEEDTNRDLDELVLIASSLATYMMLNRLSFVSSINLKKVASECYKIDGKSIIADDLTAVLKTALFEKKGDKFSFFHKSIQEYLTAYFINYKEFDSKIIKKIFSHKLKFYEEFEEVIIYLTNIQPHLFDNFVDFDPFIFRRHPYLDSSQQEKLFIKIVDKLKYERQIIWANSRFFGKSSLVIFDKIDNLEELVKKHITIGEFEYLANILESNYSKGIEDFFFELLEELKNDKRLSLEKIENSRLSLLGVNKRLFKFMKDNNCFSENSNLIFFPIEEHLFKFLYGITPFEDLIVLLEHMSGDGVSYIMHKISPENLLIWLKRVNQLKNYESNNLQWLIYGILLNYKAYASTDILFDIIEILKNVKKPIIDKEFFLSFDDIADDFWNVFFIDDDSYLEFEQILRLYKIESKHINKLADIYPRKEYKKQHRIIEYVLYDMEEQKNKITFDFDEEEAYKNEIKIVIDNDKSLTIEKFREEFNKFLMNGHFYSKIEAEYFIQLSDKYFEEFIVLIIKVLNDTIERYSNVIVRLRTRVINIIKELDKFDAKYIQSIIDYLSQIPKEVYNRLNYETEEVMVLDILSLGGTKEYKLIKKLLLLDNKNSKYLNVLHNINPNKAINDFIEIFDYHNAEALNKKEYYKILIEAISQPLYYKHKKKQFEKINKDNIQWILIDYYHFFDEYKTPIGYYQPDIYSKMNSYINSLWGFLQKNTQYIKFIEELSTYKNKKFSSIAKSLLYGLYEKQAKERGFDNNYYKDILDKKEELLHNITNNNFYAPITGIAVNQGTANQNIHLKDDKSTFNHNKLLTDLILISKQILKNVNTLEFEKENHINDKYISGLELQKYNVAGENRVNEGNERDIIIKDKNQSEKAIIEALRITSIQKDYIKEHYNKLIGRYDVMGHPIGYMLIYVKNKNFEDRWNGYKKYLSECTTFKDTNISDVSNIKVGKSEEDDKLIYHLFINFYSPDK